MYCKAIALRSVWNFYFLLQGNLHKDEAVTIGGKVRIDPSLSHYYGNSLGGIMGDVYMASTQDVSRGTSVDCTLD